MAKCKPPGKKGKRSSRASAYPLGIHRDVLGAIADASLRRPTWKKRVRVSAAHQRAVLMTLAYFVDWRDGRPSNRCRVSIASIAEHTGVCTSATSRALEVLVAAGIVERTDTSRRTTPEWQLAVNHRYLDGDTDAEKKVELTVVIERARAWYEQANRLPSTVSDTDLSTVPDTEGIPPSTVSDTEGIPTVTLYATSYVASCETEGVDSQGSVPPSDTPRTNDTCGGEWAKPTPTLPPSGAGGGCAPVACGDSPGGATHPAAAGDLDLADLVATMEDNDDHLEGEGDDHLTDDVERDPPPDGDVEEGEDHLTDEVEAETPPDGDVDGGPPPGGEQGPDGPPDGEQHPQGPRAPRRRSAKATPTRAPETDLVWKRLVSARRFDRVVRVALVITDGIRRHHEVAPTRGKGYIWVTHIHPPGKPHEGIYRVADLAMEIKAWTWRRLRAELADAERHVTDALCRIGIGEYRPEHLMVACLGFVAAKERQRHGDPLTERILLSRASPILGLNSSDEEAGGCLTDTVRWGSKWCADVWPAMTRELLAQMAADGSMAKVSAHWAWVEIQRARETAAE